jgi:hypothetical protein
LSKKKKSNPTPKPVAAPQDHLPKLSKDVTITIGEKDYLLPRLNADIVNKVPGGVVEAAMLDGEAGEAKMGFALLRAVDGYEETKEALRALPFSDMLTHLLEWLKSSGAPLGESAG